MNLMPFCMLCLLLLIGKILRVRLRLFHRLYLPTAIIAGFLGLLLLHLPGHSSLSWMAWWQPDEWAVVWGRLPGMLINFVFAALFLGMALPPVKTIWRKAAPQLAYGQIVAWGQYVVGLGMVVLLLGPLFKVSGLFGVIVPIGFEGGHGTASGMGDTFVKMGWEAGRDLGMASATAGLVSAIIIGMALINWAARRGILKEVRKLDEMNEAELSGMYPLADQPSAGRQTVLPDSIDSLALHLSFLGLAILIGMVLKAGLGTIQRWVPNMDSFPLFPLCMIGGLIVQALVSKCSKSPTGPIDHGLMQRWAGTALDFLVVSAIATMKLSVIKDNWVPFLLIIAGGILWNVFCVMCLAKRMLPDAWFERAIAEMGQSMGVTATGLLLLRVADPGSRTDASAAFAYKQLLHEPFMGGGLWTSSAVVLVFTYGAWPILGVSVAAVAIWLTVWWFVIRPSIRTEDG